ncbi:hypothetical protein D1007_29125 [Hordeum vulgare]|nr:hypothetical protein D1007_29125 [Hordeum vulgare]
MLGSEHTLTLYAGEHVVFGRHFNLGFGLPTSRFPLQFLEFYGLQIHHLGTNSILYLACLMMLCEGYFGFWPFSSLFHVFFHFRTQKNDNVPYACGGVVLHSRRNAFFPHMNLVESFKKWHRTFFYIRSVREGHDWVNLPSFVDAPPNNSNWLLEPHNDEIIAILSRLKQLKVVEGLMPANLVAAFISCRVLSL